jgi:hypothetical protein
VPAQRGPWIPNRLLASEQETELEGFVEADVWAFGGSREGLRKREGQQLPAAPLSFLAGLIADHGSAK